MTEQSIVKDVSAAPVRGAGLKRLMSLLGPVISVVMLGVALWFLHGELAGLSRAEIVDHVRSIPVFALFLSVVFAACGYLILTTYDATALHYLRKEVPFRRSALTAFMAYAVGHNVGVAALSGGTIRYRMYTLAGLTASEIARVVVFVTLTFWLGASALLGVALITMPAAQTSLLRFPSTVLDAVGILLLLVPMAYVAISFLHRTPITFRNWRVEMPRPHIAVTQLGISVADMSFACATLYILLEPSLHIGFFPFLGIYLLAMGAGIISSVPGGIGVFEAVLVAAFPQIDSAVLLGTIIVYRLIYYVMPLSLALVLLAGHESQQHGDILKRSSETAFRWLSSIAPQVIGATVFLAGVVLLVSGSSPAIESRLHLIARGIPLTILELSHLIGSIVGVTLLILARGLYRRLHGAYLAALIALSIGIGLLLLKGLDYEEALVLGVVAIVLWLSREEFYRQGSIVSQPFSAQWIAAVVLALSIAIWVGFMSFRHIEYANELWWQFAIDDGAPRMLRASVIAAIAAIGFAFWKVVSRVSNVPLPAASMDDLDQVRRVLVTGKCASANIALLGDKRFLWSANRQAFIMYQISRDSWIAMGDPVGPEQEHEELVWAFRELVDRYNGRVVFYQVSDKSLALYVDLGLTLAKLGEDASVPLNGFSLLGSHRAELRQAVNRAKKNGASFEIVARAAIPGIFTDLRRVSDSWLADKSTSEKGFSIGSFSEAYVENFDCAVVRINETIVAFANLWPAPAGGELSIDLMRYDQNAPKGIMDYLFAELMLWGAANSYQRFSLGMAPLSGMEQRSLAPLWHKVGHLVFKHGESFYNFAGLRRYKDKFDPEWEARYLACPGGWTSVPAALLDVSRLISGGIVKIVKK